MRARWQQAEGRLPTVTAVGSLGLVPLGFDIGLGSSGGPVFDDSGRVAGIALAILAERRSTSAGYDEFKDTGMGLMLPAATFCDTVRTAESAALPVTAAPREGGVLRPTGNLRPVGG